MPAVDASHELADEMSVEQRRLTVRCAGRPFRLLRGEQRAHAVPVVERLCAGGCVDRDHTGLVRQHVADRRRRGELRPVALHGCIEVEQAAVDEHERAHRGEWF